MHLGKLLTTTHIVPFMQAEEHWPAIQELVDHLDHHGLLQRSCKDQVLSALHQREEVTSTGIGSGVAIPHAFCPEIDEVVAVFGRSQQGIEFGAIDNSPVRYIMLFIVPSSQYHLHLQTLAAIAKMFNNCDIRKALSRAESEEEILDVLAQRTCRVA
ncbi:MAG: PTS sugar transporter subunit IIA [Verrucomicrobiota bacterium]